MKKHIYIPLTLLLAWNLASCKSVKQSPQIAYIKGEYVAVTTTNNPDPELKQYIDGYKIQLDAQMNRIVGRTDQYMTTGAPESYLTNLVTDAMTQIDTKYTNGKTVDLAFMNVHGIRAPFAQGDITLGDVFSAFPFENTLNVLEIKGKYLKEIFEAIVDKGMVGVSHEAKIEAKNKQVVSAHINNKDIENEKVYTVVTLDYLADGNDGMTAFTKAESNTNTNISLRDYMLDNFEKQTKANKPITSELDGRITILN